MGKEKDSSFDPFYVSPGLIFNPEGKGFMNLGELRKVNYGPGFRIATLPELAELRLAYDYLQQKDPRAAWKFANTFRSHNIIGNTAIHYFPGRGVFVEDNPQMENGKIVTPPLEALEDSLGNYEEMGVVFSKDGGRIRFTHSLTQNPSPLTGLIAVVGDGKRVERLIKSAKGLLFYVLGDLELPRVASIDSIVPNMLSISAIPAGAFGYSYGIFDRKIPRA